MIKNTLLIPALLVFFIGVVRAQTANDLAIKKMTDSLRLAAFSDYAMKYPILRQGFLSADIIPSSDVSAELNGKELYRGKINTTRVRGSFNVPFSQWGRGVLAGTINSNHW